MVSTTFISAKQSVVNMFNMHLRNMKTLGAHFYINPQVVQFS